MNLQDKTKDELIKELQELQQKYTSCKALYNTDITERKHAEVELRESQSLYYSFIEQLPNAVFRKDRDGRYVLVNTKFCKLKGLTKEDFIGRKPMEIATREIITQGEQGQATKYASLGEDLHEQILQTGKTFETEEEYPTSDFGKQYMYVIRMPVFDSSGTIIGSQGIMFDITEHKLIEEALKHEQYLMHALMNNVPDPIYFKDCESRFIRINNAHAKLFGLSDPAQAVGKTDLDFFTEEHAKQAYNDEQIIIQTGQPISKEERETWPDRPDTWVSTAKMPLLDKDKKIVGTFGISVDITERKLTEIKLFEKNKEIEAQNEEYQQINEELLQTINELNIAKEHAEESDRLKTAFLQNMSHEIRTPMNAIMGFSELLVNQHHNKEKVEKYSAIINQRCCNLLDIINDILDITRIETGQLPVYLEECNLNALFGELTLFFKEYQHRLGKQQIDFSMQGLCASPDFIIVTDKDKLKQIFINLISNAFKFTDAGTIEGGCKLDTNRNLSFYVTDTGVGIAKDKQQIIFDRFAQLSPGTSKVVSGTGLGLSIVKGLLSLLGGEIFLESEPSKGSTFSFTIPYKTI